METLLKNLGNEIGINLDKEQLLKFLLYKEKLVEKNKEINLTAITEDKEIIIKHFIDSLTINKYVASNSNLIDVGTGAGFPGVPLKIVRDDVKITLLDSLNKRLKFLNDLINDLKLENITTIHGRAEDVAHNAEYREKFDFVTARAVANLTTLSELCLPFLKVGGKFICMKGNSVEEIDEAKKAIKILGGEILQIDTFVLPETDMERNIIIIQKNFSTPLKYPRKAGTPAKEPIK